MRRELIGFEMNFGGKFTLESELLQIGHRN